MNIALFGGTFDPIHTGHIRSAKAAARKFRLDKILFIPSGNPPHKYRDHLTAFAHRFAMVALACQGDPRFIPSLLEAPRADGRRHYSVTTAQAAKRTLGPEDGLYFLLGLDAFLDLPHWKDYCRLFKLVNFIVVDRPGFDTEKVLSLSLSEGLGIARKDVRVDKSPRKTEVYLLRGVDAPVASRHIRETIRLGRRMTGLVPPLVEEYLLKEGLYGSRSGRAHR